MKKKINPDDVTGGLTAIVMWAQTVKALNLNTIPLDIRIVDDWQKICIDALELLTRMEEDNQPEEETITWDAFSAVGPKEELFRTEKATNIICPKCGRKLRKRTDITLTTYPAQYQYECDCGFKGYAYQ